MINSSLQRGNQPPKSVGFEQLMSLVLLLSSKEATAKHIEGVQNAEKSALEAFAANEELIKKAVAEAEEQAQVSEKTLKALDEKRQIVDEERAALQAEREEVSAAKELNKKRALELTELEQKAEKLLETAKNLRDDAQKQKTRNIAKEKELREWEATLTRQKEKAAAFLES